MRAFDNYPTDFHDELQSYFPAWYSGVREMDAIWRVTGDLYDILLGDIRAALDSVSLTQCDRDTIDRIMSWAGISFTTDMSDALARICLLLFLGGFGKCSKTKIISLLKKIMGAVATVTFEPIDEAGNHALCIRIDVDESDNWTPTDVDIILDRICPAHIQRDMHYFSATKRENTAYVGIVLYGSCKLTLGTTPAPNLNDENWFADGLGNIMTDGRGVAMTYN